MCNVTDTLRSEQLYFLYLLCLKNSAWFRWSGVAAGWKRRCSVRWWRQLLRKWIDSSSALPRWAGLEPFKQPWTSLPSNKHSPSTPLHRPCKSFHVWIKQIYLCLMYLTHKQIHYMGWYSDSHILVKLYTLWCTWSCLFEIKNPDTKNNMIGVGVGV